jgi:hypothetical protein
MVEPVAVAKALVTAGKSAMAVRKKLAEIGPTARLREAWEIDQRSFRAQRDAQVDARLGALEREAADKDAFATEVATMLNDRQFLKVHANLEWEAAREAIEERRRMLAHLAAGLSDPGLPVYDKARIERVVRDLDPDDVRHLHSVDVCDNPSFVPDPTSSGDPEANRQWHLAKDRLRVLQSNALAHAALVAAGCVGIEAATIGGAVVHVTAIGKLVLAALSSFLGSSQEDGPDAEGR